MYYSAYTVKDMMINECLLINQKDGFDLTLTFEDEFMDPEDLFDDPQDLEDIYSGKVTYLIAIVTASKAGVDLAQTSLGCVTYVNLDDFLIDGYYEDMIDEVVTEAKAKLEELRHV